jgi:hypothetical protein
LVLTISGSEDFQSWIKKTRNVADIQIFVDDEQKFLAYELAERYAQYCDLYVRSYTDRINRGPK